VGLTLKLIDLDSACNYLRKECTGYKVSSAYCPPEMVSKGLYDAYTLRVRNWDDVGNTGVALLAADPSQDMWALGCVLYLLCTGSTLFQSTVQDNVSDEADLEVLYEWADEDKEGKLCLVQDKLARNLISVLLSKDPQKRPSATRALQHPFFTGKSVTRLLGERPSWDVFISYRSDADWEIAERIYDELTSSGVSVWWDKRCLKPGQNWEEGFCSGLVDCSALVCLLSREGMKNANNPLMNFERLEPNSKCDNVLLEWRLALELKERGMLLGLYPVMIGDVESTTDSHSRSYSNYFKSGCNPAAPDITIDVLENKLREHLDRESLGYPYKNSESVKSLLQTVLSNQGGFVEGEQETAISTVCASIRAMVQDIREVSKALLAFITYWSGLPGVACFK